MNEMTRGEKWLGVYSSWRSLWSSALHRAYTPHWRPASQHQAFRAGPLPLTPRQKGKSLLTLSRLRTRKGHLMSLQELCIHFSRHISMLLAQRICVLLPGSLGSQTF